MQSVEGQVTKRGINPPANNSEATTSSDSDQLDTVRPTHQSRRPRPVSGSPESDATEVQPATGKRKRKGYRPAEPEDHSGLGLSLDLILRRLDTLSTESRAARDELAKEARADREDIRKSIASLRSASECPSNSEGTDGEPQPGTSGVEQPRKASAMSELLAKAVIPLKQLRADGPSASIANEALRIGAAAADEHSTKKMKSGFLLTINDNVHVQAQWPQLNVYRATSNLATYSSLSINEFCAGYITFVKDNLGSIKPDIDIALDDLNYLNDLLDEVPLMGWEAVRAAHGEMLRSVEQGRLIWGDKPKRSRLFTKALRRAHLEELAKKGQESIESTPQPAIE